MRESELVSYGVDARHGFDCDTGRARFALPCPPELARARRQRAAERLHRLGARAVFELLDEIGRHHPATAEDIDRRLERYAARSNAELLRETGGDRLPALPMRIVGGAV